MYYEHVYLDDPLLPRKSNVEMIKAFSVLIASIACESTATVVLRGCALGVFASYWYILAYALYGSSFLLLPIVMRIMDVTVVYALWSGIGVAFTTFAGVVIFHEPLTLHRFCGLGLITIGCVYVTS